MFDAHRAPRRAPLLLCAALLASCACQTAPKRKQYVFRGQTMGTSFTVKVVAPELGASAAQELRKLVDSELAAVNSTMSTYLEDSELSRLNRHQGNQPFPVSPELLRVLIQARRIGLATGGAFDVTVGPLVDAWGFGPDPRPKEPPSAEITDRLRAITGWDKIEIDDLAATVTKSRTGVRCDLSGIAKGYGVDRVSEALQAKGQLNHMVEVGGEVRTSGVNQSGRPWRIAIERPEVGRGGVERVLELRDLALATSGDYRNFYEINGVRITHIIDPRTGQPIRHRLASVSVVASSCAPADGFATALMVLGENEGYQSAVDNNLAALFLIRNLDGQFTEKMTPRFEMLFGGGDQGERP